MLIFLVCINILALGILLCWYGEKEDNFIISMSGITLSIVIGIILFIMISVLVICQSENRKEATQLTIDHANLTYYIHHLEDYKERTVVESINIYNAKLKDFRAKQSSPWLNWFYSGDVSECEYIIWKD